MQLTVAAEGADLHYQWIRNGDFVPNAVGASLVISNAQPRDGGTYSVLVYNDGGAVRSESARFKVVSAPLPFADDFENRGMLTGGSGIGSTVNSTATSQATDPAINGVRRHQSVWASWTAPAGGLVRFTTLGSDFDTVLTVYTGTAAGALTQVATDDESAGYRNSEVLFRADAGVTYQIRVDSFQKGVGGNIVVAWNFVPSGCLLSLDGLLPLNDLIALPGLPLTLCVNINLPLPLLCDVSLQWYHNGVAVPGAIAPCLLLPIVDANSVGTYSLKLTIGNSSFWIASSEVQISSEGANALAHNRLDDARRTPLIGVPSADASQSASPSESQSISKSTKTSSEKSFTPVASGYSGSQVFRTYTGKDPGEPSACGVEGGASYWFAYSPPESGTLRVSTDGSTFDTVLAVFVDDGRDLGYESLVQLACDNDSGADGKTSTLTVPVSQGTTYYIMVDGVNGASGRVSLNYALDSAPVVSGIAAQMIHANESTGWIPFTIGDRETPSAQLIVAGTCHDTALVAPAGIEFSGTGSNRLVRITPNSDAFGTNLVCLTVSDAAGGTRTNQFLLCVMRMPTPLDIVPEMAAGIAGVPYSAQIGATGGSAPYSFDFVTTPPDGWTLTTNGLLSGTPPLAGTNSFDVRVTDSQGANASRVLSLCVIDAIRLIPTLSAGGLEFRFTGRPGRSYVLETATAIDAAVWEPVITNSSPSGDIEIPVPPPAAPAAFFRVREQ